MTIWQGIAFAYVIILLFQVDKRATRLEEKLDKLIEAVDTLPLNELRSAIEAVEPTDTKLIESRLNDIENTLNSLLPDSGEDDDFRA